MSVEGCQGNGESFCVMLGEGEMSESRCLQLLCPGGSELRLCLLYLMLIRCLCVISWRADVNTFPLGP